MEFLRLALVLILIPFLINCSSKKQEVKPAINISRVKPEPEPARVYSSEYLEETGGCLWPIPNSSPVNYRIEILSEIHRGENKLMAPKLNKNPYIKKIPDRDFSSHYNKLFKDKEVFESELQLNSQDINWEKENVIILTESTTYKHGSLESTTNLMGVSLSDSKEKIYVGFSSNFHGVCQGIAQLQEWFSYSTKTFYLVLPKGSETIEHVNCFNGPDCSNIP